MGTLGYSTANDVSGDATVIVSLMDDGGRDHMVV